MMIHSSFFLFYASLLSTPSAQLVRTGTYRLRVRTCAVVGSFLLCDTADFILLFLFFDAFRSQTKKKPKIQRIDSSSLALAPVLLIGRANNMKIYSPLLSSTTTKTTVVIVAILLGMTSSVTSVKAFTSRFLSVTSSSRANIVRGGGGGASSASYTARNMADTATTAPSSSVGTTNGFLQQDGLPKFTIIEPKDLTPAVETLLKTMEEEFTTMEETLKSSSKIGEYDEVLPKLEQIQHGLGYAWGIAGHLNGVKNGDELREAYESNQPKVVQAMTKFSQSKPLYDALLQLEETWKNSEEETKDEDSISSSSFEIQQQRRAVEQSLQAMTLGGVGLEGSDKERFNDIKMKLASLSTKFSNNLLDETKAFSITVDTKDTMDGVPASAKAQWAQAHATYCNKDKKEDDEEKVVEVNSETGPWRITLDMPSYLPALQHLSDRTLREQLYRANLGKASDASKDSDKNNIPLIYEILQLKTEMAQLLGYKTYAELSLAKKMAPSVQAVSELTDLIAKRSIPAAKRELEEITTLARTQGGEEYSESNLSKLQPWDIPFWSERLKESKFDLTDEELRPYFALPAVLDGMFGLVERLFDIEVKAADGETDVWHSDVRFFKIYNKATGDHMASFYLDPYSRPENKRGGAWMDTCVGKSKAMNINVPVAYLTCNGSPPVGTTTPSLMTFREVETLFHEFGHGLQHMLTKATVGDVAGINGVEWDAVELPSQFMENWCYDRPTVYGFAKHYETGEPLPEDMFQKLCDQKIFGAGMMACRQLYFGQMDLALHDGYDATKGASGEGPSIFDIQREIASKYVPHQMPLEEDRFLCAFGHIFAGGYSAGYYSYKWAEVMSADAFAAFEDVGLDNEDEVRRVGKLFRDTVLSLGGGVPPMEVFRQFRGREPAPDALLRHNGLA